jgi:2-C-methyl-D-erythritol 4-phosphate cytidylyltransferase
VGAVIVAAGQSLRMDGVNKVFASIPDRSLIAYTLAPFEQTPLVNEVVLVLAPDKIAEGLALKEREGWAKVVAVCSGGSLRQESVLEGLKHLTSCYWVVVHDGARPCLASEVIESGLEFAEETGAAVAAVPATDTIKVVSPQGLVESTLPRDCLWQVQTPQIFRYDLLLRAHNSCKGVFTDDSAMVENIGSRVKVFPGSLDNIKVTTQADLLRVESFFRQREEMTRAVP